MSARDVLVRIEEPGTVRDLVEVLVETMQWPRETIDGNVLSYRMRLLGSERPLDEATPAASLKLAQGDTVVIGPAR
ncbi:MAG: hypothetical protein AMXMBFR80_09280 [Dehalococcoidia bacterium]